VAAGRSFEWALPPDPLLPARRAWRVRSARDGSGPEAIRG
jgi:hypothetical protein